MRSALVLGLLGTALATSAEVDPLAKFRLTSTTKYTKSDKVDVKLAKRDGGDYVDIANDLVKTVAPNATFRKLDGHYVSGNGVGHVYFVQTSNGVDIDNAVFNVNVKDGRVFSYGNSFFEGSLPAAKAKDSMGAVKALDVVRDTLNLPVSSEKAVLSRRGTEHYDITGVAGVTHDPAAKMVYVVKPDGELALTWKVETRLDESALSSYVDIHAEEVVGVVNHVSHATYEVYPYPANDPREGTRKVLTDPGRPEASKLGWHDSNNQTSGNNIFAGAVPSSNGQVILAQSKNLTFEYPFVVDALSPDNLESREAAITQVFYTTNMLHDLYYLMGFTPAAGNYQVNNTGEGGLANDPVRVLVQYYSMKNNGQFFQTVDGQSPDLRMYLFDHTDPERDSGFDQGFVTHEYTHGLSERLTGGPTVLGCLNSYEPDGMAEGWSDLYAAALTIKPNETRSTAAYGFAAWPLDKDDPPTARLVMYSTNTTINNFTYSSVNGKTKNHEVGSAWATMLYEVLWNLIDKYGKNDSFFPDIVDGVPTDGKFLTLKLLLDAFAIQPCNPSFIQARDAILDADKALTGGKNQCEIWTGFAKRGLGEGAVSADTRVDNFVMPAGVC